MTLQATERLLTILRANGVNYFKSNDVEIRIGALETLTAGMRVSPEPTIVPRGTGSLASEPKMNRASSNPGDVPARELKIPHQLNEMISVLKMGDEDLVNKLFPEGAPQEQQADD